MAKILALMDEYVRSLSYIILSPKKITSLGNSKIIVYSLITLILIASSKETVIIGSIFYKAIKWTITLFPRYSFIYAYADYVSFWIVLIALLIEIGVCYVYALILHYTVRLLGGKSKVIVTLGLTAYAWVVDLVLIVVGLASISIDIPLTITIILASLLISLILKLVLIARSISVVYGLKPSTSILAVILVAILLAIIGLTIIIA